MALTLGTLETGTRVLVTCVPSCTGMPARFFFMLEAHGPQEIVGHAVPAPEPSR
jgi:hypothetical protein